MTSDTTPEKENDGLVVLFTKAFTQSVLPTTPEPVAVDRT
jgi:hypothetical protein